MAAESDATAATPASRTPTLEEVAHALGEHIAANGTLRPGVAEELIAERGWHGRLVEVLAVLTRDEEQMGYLAGGRRPDEVMSWLPLWADSPLSVEEIRTIVASAGWDPEPFGVVVRAGLLDRLVRRPDGSQRRVGGELAGAWLSDQFAMAGDEEILAAVRSLLDDDGAPG